MEQKVSWTEASQDIFLSPFKHCPSNESPTVDTNKLGTKDSMIKTQKYQPTSATEATLTLDWKGLQLLHDHPETRQPYRQKGRWFNEGTTPNEPYVSFITEATVTAPPTVFPLFANFETSEKCPSDAEETDDQAEHSDPFEYDNAPEYRAVLGSCSKDTTPKLSTTPSHADEDSDGDLVLPRKMARLGSSRWWRRGKSRRRHSDPK